MTIELNQDGMMGGLNPGERVREFEPGSNLPDVGSYGGMMGGDGGMMPDLGQSDMMNISVPDDPGPAATGRTPVLGSARRSRDLPVLRDELMGAMG